MAFRSPFEEVAKNPSIYDIEHGQLGGIVPHDDPNTVQLEIERYVLDESGNKTGYIRHVGYRKLSDIKDDIVVMLGSLNKELDYFSIVNRDVDARWMSGQIACYAVTGSNEGYYIDVSVIYAGKSTGMFVLKTFLGMDKALEIANKLTKILGA